MSGLTLTSGVDPIVGPWSARASPLACWRDALRSLYSVMTPGSSRAPPSTILRAIDAIDSARGRSSSADDRASDDAASGEDWQTNHGTLGARRIRALRRSATARRDAGRRGRSSARALAARPLSGRARPRRRAVVARCTARRTSRARHHDRGPADRCRSTLHLLPRIASSQLRSLRRAQRDQLRRVRRIRSLSRRARHRAILRRVRRRRPRPLRPLLRRNDSL